MARGFKTGGRELGTPNHISKDLREALTVALSPELKELPQTLAKLDPEKRLEFTIKLLPYILPRLESVSFDTSNQDEPVKQVFIIGGMEIEI